MIKKRELFIISLLVLTTYLQAAVFNRVNTLVNTPIARKGNIGSFQLGFAYSPYTLNNNAYWEEDIYLNYHLTDFLILGVTRINNFEVAGNIQLMIAKDFLVQNLNLAVGVENMKQKDKSSTFDTLDENYANRNSLYAVSTYRINQWEISLGFGDGRLANFYKPYVFPLSNMFYSLTYFFAKDGENTGYFCVEFDARDYNLGLVLPITDQLKFKFALTQFPWGEANNANYGDIPYQTMCFGVEFETNFFTFYGEEYNKFSGKIKKIEEQTSIIGEKYSSALQESDNITRLGKKLKTDKEKWTRDVNKLLKELKAEKEKLKNEIKALRDVVASQGFKSVHTLKEDIMQHYYKALRYYYDEEYFKAVEEITKAILLNDRIPELHIRLGSIYWTLDLREEARTSWRMAYELDSNNEEFNQFLKEKGIKFKNEEAKKK